LAQAVGPKTQGALVLSFIVLSSRSKDSNCNDDACLLSSRGDLDNFTG